MSKFFKGNFTDSVLDAWVKDSWETRYKAFART